ncbi:MAG: aminotransferase class III-fold pyridoxal phosphate-dependent enzyme, partial [Balneolales bacterium]|nr:aminotransferase class III-fold pyridoxal phosphate-dependent enzyme [Balneolales bacterium]
PAKVDNVKNDDIAITGISLRLPGGITSLDTLWDFLQNGESTVRTYPANRPNSQDWAKVDDNLKLANYLEEITGFDASFFGITNDEAVAMDPQQRLLLESAYHAFEDAGLPAKSLKERNIGVFTGVSSSEYRKYINDTPQKGAYDVTGNLASTASGRISYIFGLRGPAMSIDTACSSSLVALHQACRAIHSGETEISLVSAVNLILDVNGTLGLHAVQALSVDGHCKAFDDSANGYGRSEGVISLIVQPLSKAVENNNRIYAVIKSTSINHDGRSNGLTAPNGLAQQQLISQNLKNARIEPNQLVAIETHGTGTRLGDPQELGAWMEILGGSDSANAKPYLSAAKAQLGHLESAAGLAGVLKSVLMIDKGIVPAHKLASKPTSLINWTSAPFILPTEHVKFSQQPKDRFVSVSSFGLSGTNASAILTGCEHQGRGNLGWNNPGLGIPNQQSQQDNNASLFTISARSESALRELADKWLQRLESSNATEFSALLSEQIKRNNPYEFRLSVAEQTHSDLVSAIKSKLSQQIKQAPFFRTKAPIAWLFTGQGSQYPALFTSLYENSARFKIYIEECQGHLDANDAGIELETFILQADERIHLTKYTQPVLAALEISMTKMLADAGLSADVVCGHSLGEIVALCHAGVISEPDMFKLLAHRGALMAGISEKGGMMVAFADESTIKDVLQKHRSEIDIASVNTDPSVTLSGPKEQIASFQDVLQKENIRCKSLTVEQAFHSSLMDGILDEFNRVASQITYHPAKIPVILNVNGTLLKKGESIDAAYLTRQIREAVQFRKCLTTLAEFHPSVVLEIGPSAALSPMVAAAEVCNTILCVSDTEYASQVAFLRALCAINDLGLDIDFKPFIHATKPSAPLPSYPFQHTPFWVKSTTDVPIPASTIAQNAPMESSINWTSRIKQLVSDTTGFNQDHLHESVNLFELGHDSLVLLKVKAAVKERFGVEIAASQFFKEANTIEKIAQIVGSQVPQEISSVQNLPAHQQAYSGVAQNLSQNGSALGNGLMGSGSSIGNGSSNANGSIGNTHVSAVQQLIDEQLRLMHRQLDLLQNEQAPSQRNGHQVPMPSLNAEIASADVARKDQSGTKSSYVAYKSVKTAQAIGQIPKESLQKLIDEYTSMTKASKNEVATHRNWLATSRNIAGFRPDRKEMVYQIHIDRAEGAYVHDIDGNKLLDITMGFGVSLFGNKPDFIEKALRDEMQRGIGVGAMSYRAGRVARKFCELTGHQRVAFFNSGSEAVMNALRIARTYTKRNLVVQFSGAYHGNSDPILGVSIQKDGRSGAMPMSPGMPESYYADHIVLDYDSPESLSEIASRASEIAAVIVEPVQSRKPDLQPKAFLKELRVITEKHGIVLIFDETITGLRAGKNGAQGFFGVKADIATYGKIVGGGLPIGLVA